MHQVIEEHLSIRQETWPIKDRLTLKTQLPVLGPGIIREALKCRTGLGRALIESLDQLVYGVKGNPFITSFGKVELGRGQNRESESRKFSYVRSQFAQRH